MSSDHSADAGMQESVAFVTERDIDLLLVEELRSSPTFRVWWLTQVGYETPAQHELIDVRHSVIDAGLGEYDLIFRVRGGGRTAMCGNDRRQRRG